MQVLNTIAFNEYHVSYMSQKLTTGTPLLNSQLEDRGKSGRYWELGGYNGTCFFFQGCSISFLLAYKLCITQSKFIWSINQNLNRNRDQWSMVRTKFGDLSFTLVLYANHFIISHWLTGHCQEAILALRMSFSDRCYCGGVHHKKEWMYGLSDMSKKVLILERCPLVEIQL